MVSLADFTTMEQMLVDTGARGPYVALFSAHQQYGRVAEVKAPSVSLSTWSWVINQKGLRDKKGESSGDVWSSLQRRASI